ncbi:MAG: copper ion binding protein, partial [Yoonia sp.]
MNSERSLTFGVREMSCASCVGRAEKALLAVSGVQSVHVNLASETATISVTDTFKTDDATAALDTAGYPADLQTHRFSIQNMTCASCVGRLELALTATPGVVSAAVNLAKENATVRV